MMIVCTILSGLALLAAAGNIVLFFVEKKRTERRHKAMLDYIRSECSGVLKAADNNLRGYVDASLKEYNVSIKEFIGLMNAETKADIEQLKRGAYPDYEKAVAAANAVNEFNAGISSILNFDPIAAARSRRTGNEKEAAN